MDRRALALAAVLVAASIARASRADVDDEAADGVWGQPDFTSAAVPATPSTATVSRGAGIATDAAHFVAPGSAAPVFLLADREANRVLVSRRSSFTQAVGMFGQTSWTTGLPNRGLGVTSSAGVDAPSAVAFTTLGKGSGIEGFVAVADTGNHRVLLGQYFGSSVPAFSASRVYGQHGAFDRGDRNAGGAITAETLAAPEGVAFGDLESSGWPMRLYVADTGNNRILVQDPLTGLTGASQCVGQADCEHGDANRGGAAPGVNGLSEPRGLAWYSGTSDSDPARGLYVADTGNHRVLHFPVLGATLSSSATRVWGQDGDFASAVPSKGGPSATSLRSPSAVAVGPDGTLFVADTGHHRVLRFPKGAFVADFVYGQPDFATVSAPSSPSSTSLRAPMGVAVAASGTLLVSDTGHSRVLRWAARCDPAKCDDENPCTDETCDPFSGCRSQLVTISKACAPYRCDQVDKRCEDACDATRPCQAPWKCIKSRCVIPCEDDAGCPEGLSCADGVCCNERCDGACEACNEPKNEGKCVAVTGAPRHGQVCGESADVDCRGKCDGFERKSCGPARDGSGCGVEACEDGVATLRGTCTGGRCFSREQACAPFACGAAACRASCDQDWQCAPGARCAGGACVDGPIPARGGGCAFGDRPRDAYGLVSAIAVALAAIGGVSRRARRRG